LLLSTLDSRLFEGFGSDLVRNGACSFIACVAPILLHRLSKEDLNPIVERWWDILNSSLGRSEEIIVSLASHALEMFLSSSVVIFSQPIVDLYVENIGVCKDKHIKRGFSVALGSLPSKALLPNLDVIIDSLIDATMIHVGFLQWFCIIPWFRLIQITTTLKQEEIHTFLSLKFSNQPKKKSFKRIKEFLQNFFQHF
jgi:hypothetical protein